MTTPAIAMATVSRAYGDRRVYITNKMRNITNYAVASKKARGLPDPRQIIHSEQLREMHLLFDDLENDAVSPSLRIATKIVDALKLTYTHPDMFFPEDIKTRYQRLVQGWKNNNSGVVATADDDDDDDGENDNNSPAVTTADDDDDDDDDDEDDNNGGAVAPVAQNITATVKLPPTDHPIWGVNGIMHGVKPGEGKINTQVLDKRYRQRPAGVRGHNGLTPGDWFPTQMVALFRGAHGQSQAGISGNIIYGAYSIVVSGTYKDVNDDQGDIIYYSGPGGQTNEDKNKVGQHKGNSYLKASFTERNPVRVLRAVNKGSSFAPSAGLRYDGIYHVVGVDPNYRENPKGGVYTRFVLQRAPNQASLASIVSSSPTRQQLRDYRHIWDRW